MSDSPRATGSICKVDNDKHQVFGWAQVAIRKGEAEPFFDSQGDRISDVSHLEKAGYDFVLHANQRSAGEMHIRKGVGKLIESMVFTPDKLEKFATDDNGNVNRTTLQVLQKTFPIGWWVGFQITDPQVWKLVKNGTYTAFSVGGQGVRTPVEKAGMDTRDNDPDADEPEDDEQA